MKYPRFRITMHRLTARLLLLFVALGIFQPLLEAFSAEQPHACCLRRLHTPKNHPLQFRDAARPTDNCCPPLTTPHTANLVPVPTASVGLDLSIVKLRTDRHPHRAGFDSSLSTRGPPALALS